MSRPMADREIVDSLDPADLTLALVEAKRAYEINGVSWDSVPEHDQIGMVATIVRMNAARELHDPSGAVDW